MKILALEFSSRRRSVAVLDFTKDSTRLAGAEASGGTITGLMLIDRALAQAQLRPAQIDCLAVGLGPGSYTGIRSAIAIAQGWQLAHGTWLTGVDSVATLAEQAMQNGISGGISILIDAQRKEFYRAKIFINAHEVQETESLRIVSEEDARNSLPAVGPDVAKFLPRVHDLFPSAEVLGQLAAKRGVSVPGEHLEPVYLRAANFVKAPPPRHVP